MVDKINGKHLRNVLLDIAITVAAFAAATGLCYLLDYFHVNSLNFIIMYVLAVLMVAVFAKGYVYSAAL